MLQHTHIYHVGGKLRTLLLNKKYGHESRQPLAPRGQMDLLSGSGHQQLTLGESAMLGTLALVTSRKRYVVPLLSRMQCHVGQSTHLSTRVCPECVNAWKSELDRRSWTTTRWGMIQHSNPPHDITYSLVQTNFRSWQQPLYEVSASQGQNHNNPLKHRTGHVTAGRYLFINKTKEFGFQLLIYSICDYIN